MTGIYGAMPLLERKHNNFQTAETNAAVVAIIAAIEADPRGGTASLTDGQPIMFADGYLVGGVHPPSVLLWPTSRPISEAQGQILGILKAGRAERPGKVFVGWWTDHDVLFVEVAQHYTRQSAAQAMAESRHELAYYDVKAGEDVRL